MSYYHYLAVGILLLIMAIATLKILAEGQNTWQSWASNILTVVLVVEFMVWSGYCLMVGGANTAVSTCAPIFRALAPGIASAPIAQMLIQEQPVLNMVEASLWGSWSRSFCKNGSTIGVEYGIMQAY